MTDIHLMLLSALQGLTEFLPVSSSGHLILFSKFTTFPDQGLALDVAVHVGSIIAVMIYFSETIWEMVKGFLKSYCIPNFKNPGSKLAWLIIIGTIPAVIAGLFLVQSGTDELRSARLIGWTMLGFGIVLFIADKIGMTIRKIEHLGILDAILIGLAQCLALIPGTSRSGITITMGRFLGLERRGIGRLGFIPTRKHHGIDVCDGRHHLLIYRFNFSHLHHHVVVKKIDLLTICHLSLMLRQLSLT